MPRAPRPGVPRAVFRGWWRRGGSNRRPRRRNRRICVRPRRMGQEMASGTVTCGQKSPANLPVGPLRAQARAAYIWHISAPGMSLHRLIPLFERARQSREPVVLATVIRTAGSTYAKPGAQMLVARDGEYAGLLSGGCLEGDLREHARGVAASGEARIVSYDLRSK